MRPAALILVLLVSALGLSGQEPVREPLVGLQRFSDADKKDLRDGGEIAVVAIPAGEVWQVQQVYAPGGLILTPGGTFNLRGGSSPGAAVSLQQCPRLFRKETLLLPGLVIPGPGDIQFWNGRGWSIEVLRYRKEAFAGLVLNVFRQQRTDSAASATNFPAVSSNSISTPPETQAIPMPLVLPHGTNRTVDLGTLRTLHRLLTEILSSPGAP